MTVDDLLRDGGTPAAVPFVETGSYPTRGGNLVVPWIDGVPAFRRICQAIEAARRSVWATVTFMWPSFEMPDGRGSALDLLERVARRGVDVRLIFWRPDDETATLRENAFWGSPAHFELLAQRCRSLNIRWDRAHPGYCQHQKSWLIDASEETTTSFVGGINLNPHSVVTPEHDGETQNHDVYLEVAGPAVVDVQHNFVQRWNEASERERSDGRWGEASAEDLDFPTHAPRERGDVLVQIQRTTHPGRYANGHPPMNGSPFRIAAGERTNLDQYCVAIQAARRTIYLEHQYVQVPEIVSALDAALARGVQVVAMVPAVPELSRPATPALKSADNAGSLAQLAKYDAFTLCGMAGLDGDRRRTRVHVHSKLMLVDDEWGSVGSCNLHRYSLFGNGELNAAFRSSTLVRALRAALFQEHLGVDTSELTDGEALRLFQRVARDNRERHDRSDADWQGMAIRLDIG
jgi:phosphatidylserine/phosphatidylglycerophosphate/cardiolipin synthase-like enzyme